ncbi:phosphoribosyltransferase-like protein [Candidatus Mycalebacterium sp.]
MSIKERNSLVESIAETTSDYRKSDLGETTPKHVDKWVSQFDLTVQLPMLKEMDSLLKKTYFSKTRVSKWIESMLKDKYLTKGDAEKFWQKVEFLDIQLGGNSQKEMLKVFDEALQKKCGLEIIDCSADSTNTFVYLDDIIFSGNRAKRDIEHWIKNESPSHASLYIVTIGRHSGSYWIEKRIEDTIEKSGKKIALIWYPKNPHLENRKAFKNSSNVLWPTDSLCRDKEFSKYLENSKYPFAPREESSKNCQPFSSEEGRQLLEKEFFFAGLKIRSMCENPSVIMRPLGFSTLNGPGFGSTIVTFRNCPNNNPLALWWGDQSQPLNSPLSKWYPLFPRKTYDSGEVLENF